MNFGYSQKENTLTVGDLNRYIKLLLDNDALLSSVCVRGEISNLKYHTSGHLYFTLKDEEAEISAIMFRSAVNTMSFSAKNGMKVTVFGKISIYEKSGKCQLYASAMLDDGKGNLQLEYERLLKKLTDEGLFDKERKRQLPKIPKCIGIITSPTGAAVRDMINVSGRRWPQAKIILYPSLVQGAEAPESLCKGLACLNMLGECDVIIIGRGGGSIEDLWAFNDEGVVRAVAASKIPIISAVGHETDFTLCDFAADCRAPTPSSAAELAVPDKNEYKLRLDDLFEGIDRAFLHFFNTKKSKLDALKKQLDLCSPQSRVEKEKQILKFKQKLLQGAFFECLEHKKARLAIQIEKLDAVNPISVLNRGYSITTNQSGRAINSSEFLTLGEQINIKFSNGSATAKILSIEKKTEEKNNVG